MRLRRQQGPRRHDAAPEGHRTAVVRSRTSWSCPPMTTTEFPQRPGAAVGPIVSAPNPPSGGDDPTADVDATRPARTRSIAVTVLVGLLLLVVGWSWAVSSPIGSSPDDDFHLGSIWCGSFADDGLCREGEPLPEGWQREVLVPAPIARSTFDCFISRPDTSAHCADCARRAVGATAIASERRPVPGRLLRRPVAPGIEATRSLRAGDESRLVGDVLRAHRHGIGAREAPLSGTPTPFHWLSASCLSVCSCSRRRTQVA